VRLGWVKRGGSKNNYWKNWRLSFEESSCIFKEVFGVNMKSCHGTSRNSYLELNNIQLVKSPTLNTKRPSLRTGKPCVPEN
jgi:hypothetical protein